jgi:hypothetical protein
MQWRLCAVFAEGREPVWDKQIEGFLLSVKQRVPIFCVFATFAGQEFVGALAVQKEIAMAKEKKQEDITFADIRLSSQFTWLQGEACLAGFASLKDLALNHYASLAAGGVGFFPIDAAGNALRNSKLISLFELFMAKHACPYVCCHILYSIPI